MNALELAQNTHVVVQWEDSSYKRGWVYPADEGQYQLELKPSRARTTGWVIACTPDALTIASSIAEEGGALNPLTLAWGAILELITLSDYELGKAVEADANERSDT